MVTTSGQTCPEVVTITVSDTFDSSSEDPTIGGKAPVWDMKPSELMTGPEGTIKKSGKRPVLLLYNTY